MNYLKATYTFHVLQVNDVRGGYTYTYNFTTGLLSTYCRGPLPNDSGPLPNNST